MPEHRVPDRAVSTTLDGAYDDVFTTVDESVHLALERTTVVAVLRDVTRV